MVRDDWKCGKCLNLGMSGSYREDYPNVCYHCSRMYPDRCTEKEEKEIENNTWKVSNVVTRFEKLKQITITAENSLINIEMLGG